MSWIVDSSLTHFQKFCANVLKCGPIPKHVAFIMDGNRRYATKANVEKAEGHTRGFDKLAETLQWCLELGITEVTVYAFSIENFKRSKSEVDTLMDLAVEKFTKLLEEKDKIMEEGVCIRIIGNMSLLPQQLRALLAEAVLMTKDNKRAVLNVAFAYTSRDEIFTAVGDIVEGVQKGLIGVDDIDEELISDCLFTAHSCNPDIIVRTSGEVLWPEFCIWHLFACVFMYQRCYNDLRKDTVKKIQNERTTKFVEVVHNKRMMQLKKYLA